MRDRAAIVGAGALAAFLFLRGRGVARASHARGVAEAQLVTGRVPGRFALSEAEADRFYADVLAELQLTPTDNRLRFARAWRLAEGAEAAWNPWNTTWAGKVSPGVRASKYNSAGVGNYATRADGVAATAKTLRLRYYADLRARLTRDDTPGLVAQSPDLRTWGTGAGVARMLLAFPDAIPYRSPLFGV